MTAYIHELPSFVALIFKLILLVYAAKSTVKNSVTKVYMALLVLLSLFNFVEFTGINYLARNGFDEVVNQFGFVYFFLLIPAIAVMLHISIRLSFDSTVSYLKKNYLFLLYIPVLLLEFLLIFTDQLIAGFAPFKYSILRVPGPLYFIFETFATVYMLAATFNLLHGARNQRTALARTRNRLWLLALAPIVLVVIYLITANHFGWTKLTSTFYFPIAITFFLLVTTYATYRYRLFAIELYIPWSKIRKRKTAFYNRIRAMIAEIADLGAVNNAVERLAETLRCPVALVSTNKSILAVAGESQNMPEISRDILHKYDHIVVANEIADSAPETYAAMKNHGVAAIVPFYPHSQTASGWLLLGDSFGEEVYTPLDFRMVEQLFDKMADLFLDKLLTMRTQLATAHNQIHTLQLQHQEIQSRVTTLQNDISVLRKQNIRLVKEQRADSMIHDHPETQTTAGLITLLGRDKAMLKAMRATFPQTIQFVGPDSSGFKRQALPDILVCRIEVGPGSVQNKLLDLFTAHRGRIALLLYGPAAADFVDRNKQALVGSLVELLPEELASELLARKVQALMQLHKYTHSVSHPDHPLISQHPNLIHAFTEADRIAGFKESVVIKRHEADEAVSLALYIHESSKRDGSFNVLRTTEFDLEEFERQLLTVLSENRVGTLMIDDIDDLPINLREKIIKEARSQDIRLIAGGDATQAVDSDFPLGTRHVFTLAMPMLRERKIDLPLLIHYFTLQFNLQAGTSRYLSQSEVDDLMADNYPKDMAALKSFVFNNLKSKEQQSPTAPNFNDSELDKTLDEHVIEYETRIIEQTLKRCGGNKSKAARLLGLRPNTLHYKLERYGLSGGKKN